MSTDPHRLTVGTGAIVLCGPHAGEVVTIEALSVDGALARCDGTSHTWHVALDWLEPLGT